MKEYNIISANCECGKEHKTRNVYQYNNGMILRIKGIDLPESFRVDFANDLTGESKSQIGSNSEVGIPYEFFIPGSFIHCWIVVTGEDYSVTIHHVVIPVDMRAEPTNYEPTTEEISVIDQTLAALNYAVEKSETNVTHYPRIVDGIWEVWNAETNEFIPTETHATGATYTPFVDQDGTISWTNDRDLLNPEPINIKGPTGDRGEKGDPFTYSDFTEEQLEGLRGPKGNQGIQGPKGDKGDTGAVGPKGDKGDKGDTGSQGQQGPQGLKGDPFTYSDFTQEQLEGLRGPQGIQGNPGPKGDTGEKGDTGLPGEDGADGQNGATFTPTVSQEGVISWTNNGNLPNPTPINIKGPQGIQGDKGDTGAQGPKGDTGATGPQGETGATGPQGPKGDTGEQGVSGVYIGTEAPTDPDTNVWIDPNGASDSPELEEIEEELSELESAITDYIAEVQFTTVSGEFVNFNGIIRPESNFSRSQPIQVEKGERYLLIATGYLQNVAMIATSNLDATSFTVKALSTGNDESIYTYEVEADGYIVVSYITAKRCVLFKQNIMRGTSISTIEEIENQLSNIDDEVDELSEHLSAVIGIVESKNKYYSAAVENGFIIQNGTIATQDSYANYRTSDYIPIKPNTDYRYAVFNPNSLAVSTGRKACLLYDSNKNLVSGLYQNVSNTNSLLIENTSASYVRFSFYYNALSMLTEGSTEETTYTPYYEPYEVINAKLGDVPIEQVKKEAGSGILNGKKWVVCGDSFSNYTNKDIDGGKFDGQDATYPRLIAERCNMELVQTFFKDGRTLAFPAVPGSFVNSLTCPTADCYYQNIPADADYITLYIGINDEHHYTGGGDGEDPTGLITLGTIDDDTTATYYGAWNVVLSWLITNRPNAHIGIIVTNGLSIADWRAAQINIAQKYGIPYIDMNGNERTPVMLRTINPDIPNSVRSALTTKWAVDPTGAGGSVNTHPNWQAHEYESTFIENFLRSL